MLIKLYYRFLFIIIVFVSISCVTTNKLQNAENEILNCFENYQKALLNKDYKFLIELVSKNTFRYYDNILKLAVYGNKNQILKQPLLIDKIYILSIRHLIPLDDLLDMSGEELFTFGIKKNYIDNNAFINLKIKHIEINKSEAIADIQLEDYITDMKILFIREKKEWKIDISSILFFLNNSYIKLLEQYDIEELYFLKNIIYNITGIESNEELLFKPLL